MALERFARVIGGNLIGTFNAIGLGRGLYTAMIRMPTASGPCNQHGFHRGVRRANRPGGGLAAPRFQISGSSL
jgi:hypothetical protein